jgi:hypothetical protein
MKRPVSLFNPDAAVEAELEALTRDYEVCAYSTCINVVGKKGDKCIEHRPRIVDRAPANQLLF